MLEYTGAGGVRFNEPTTLGWKEPIAVEDRTALRLRLKVAKEGAGDPSIAAGFLCYDDSLNLLGQLLTMTASVTQTDTWQEIVQDFSEWPEGTTQILMVFQHQSTDTVVIVDEFAYSDITAINEANLISATLTEDYWTSVQADEAIANATTALKTAIEDPDGSSIGADLVNNYYTKTTADQAIAQATTDLKSEIEDPEGDSIGATLSQDYYTKTAADEAISAATTTLSSDLDDVTADLENNYYTSAQADTAISAATSSLKSDIEDPQGSSIGADLENNYYTSSDVDGAISSANTTLKSEIEDPNGSSLGADLENNYYTITQADSAISSATSALKSAIEDPQGNSIAATLTQDYYTSSDVDDEIGTAKASLRTELSASSMSGRLPVKATFTDGTLGEWGDDGDLASVVGVSNAPDYDKAIQIEQGAVGYGEYAEGNIEGKQYRIKGTAQTNVSDEALRVGMQIIKSDGTFGGYSNECIAAGQGWTDFDVTVTINERTKAFRPAFFIWGSGAKHARISRIEFYDVTQQAEVTANIEENYLATADAEDTVISAVEQRLTGTLGDLDGDVEDIKSLSLGGSTAFGTLIQQLEVNAGGNSGKIDSIGSVVARLDNTVSAGYMFRAKANNEVSMLDLIATDGRNASYSIARLSADDILLEGSVTAQHLTVADFSGNMVLDGNFSRDVLTGAWRSIPTGFYLVDMTVPGGFGTVRDNCPTHKALRMEPGSTRHMEVNVPDGGMQANAGDTFNVQFQYANNNGPNGQGHGGVIVRFYDRTGTLIDSSFQGVIYMSTNQWPWHQYTYTAPANTQYVKIMTRINDSSQDDVFLTNIRVTRMGEAATVITPGSVTSDLIEGNAVKAVHIQGGEITTNHLDSQTFQNDGLAIFGGNVTSEDYWSTDDGWVIYQSGRAVFKNIVVDQRIVVAEGTMSFGDFYPGTGTSGTNHPDWAEAGETFWITSTGLNINAWAGTNKTYAVTVEHLSGGVQEYNNQNPDVYWGWKGDLFPLTRWNGNQSMRLRIQYWSRNVTRQRSGSLKYRIYELI